MRASFLFVPAGLLLLAGCVDVHEQPRPAATTVVAPTAPPANVVANPGTGTTVVTHP
ncbi:MAG: hypothetical protein JO227_07745 [Acetobacteraceae bacterium]|nr:hypothetical protein [Acetobacteraceae bacterium]